MDELDAPSVEHSPASALSALPVGASLVGSGEMGRLSLCGDVLLDDGLPEPPSAAAGVTGEPGRSSDNVGELGTCCCYLVR